MPLHPPQQLRRLPREHRPDDQLDVALQLRQGMVLGTVRCCVIGFASLGLILWR
jgi:hypothetical protein